MRPFLRFIDPPAYLRQKQRPTPNIPCSAVRHLQALSASWRFTPLSTYPPCFIRDPLLGFGTFRGFPSASSPQSPLDVTCPSCSFHAYSAVRLLSHRRSDGNCANRQHSVAPRRSTRPGYPRMLTSIQTLTHSPKRMNPRRHAANYSPDCRSSHQPKLMRPCALRRNAGFMNTATPPSSRRSDRRERHMSLRTLRAETRRPNSELGQAPTAIAEATAAFLCPLPDGVLVHAETRK
jgi:hypothetical protein